MSKNSVPEKKQETSKENKSDFLTPLVVTIVSAIAPPILLNLNLHPNTSIGLMVFLGILAIITIYVVFKYPNTQIVNRLTFPTKISDRKATLLFILLIIYVVMLSSYIFLKISTLEIEEQIEYNDYVGIKSNIENLSFELSKLTPYLDSVRFNKEIFNKYNKKILDGGCKYIEKEYGLEEGDLIISMFKKIKNKDEEYVYEQNWSGDIEVDKCFILSNNSLIGCAFGNKEIFVLYKPDLDDKQKCAWDTEKNKIASWHQSTNDILFNENSKCKFNKLHDDYNRKGILCFYSNLKNEKSELGICLDFRNTPNDNIYYEEKIQSTILNMIKEIMKHPDNFYSETDFNKLRERIKKNCNKQKFNPDYPVTPYEH